MRFVDTNVLLYTVSRDPDERHKAAIAAAILTDRDLALSVQVLQEFFVQATRRTRDDALTHEQAADLVAAFGRFPVQDTTSELVHAAIVAKATYGLSYWDAAIIEAARMSGCDILLTEDLSHGQDYGGVTALDPFR